MEPVCITQTNKTLILQPQIDAQQENPQIKLKSILKKIEFEVNGVMIGRAQNSQIQDPHAKIDEMFQKLQNVSTQGMQELKALVKSKIPIEPDSKNYANDQEFSKAMQQYENEMNNYRSLLQMVRILVENLTNMFEEKLRKIQDFYDKMWKEIKKGNEKGAKKEMDDFNRNLAWNFKDTLNGIQNMIEKINI